MCRTIRGLHSARRWAAALVVLAMTRLASGASFTYTLFNDPLAFDGQTTPCGICGNTIVGTYEDAQSIGHGFIYKIGSGFTTLDDPLCHSTVARGIFGNTIVGDYIVNPEIGDPSGFTFNTSTDTFTDLDDPLGVNGTIPNAIFGNLIVGTYYDSTYHSHGFVYNGSTFTTLDDPGSTNTSATGIFQNTIVGYSQNPDVQGWSYDGSSFTNPTALENSYPLGISGNTIAGDFSANYGFVYDGSTFSIIDPPGAEIAPGVGVDVDGIYNGTLIGQYYTGTRYRAFIATPVPEPDLGLLCLSCLAGLTLKRRPHDVAHAPTPQSYSITKI